MMKTFSGDEVDAIMAYEQGDLNEEQIVELFQSLIDSGMVNSLQGHYGRTAAILIEHGRCTQKKG